MTNKRSSKIERKTSETNINASWNLDTTSGGDTFAIKTPSGFFTHMLEQLAKHSQTDLQLTATGDSHIDFHHIVEDCGIVLGRAFNEALADKKGISRYHSLDLIMDDALISGAIDISGRPFLAWQVEFPTQKIGEFDCELVREFFHSFCQNAKIAVHITKRAGINSHHISEACFKCLARLIRAAIKIDSNSIASTKGVLH